MAVKDPRVTEINDRNRRSVDQPGGHTIEREESTQSDQEGWYAQPRKQQTVDEAAPEPDHERYRNGHASHKAPMAQAHRSDDSAKGRDRADRQVNAADENRESAGETDDKQHRHLNRNVLPVEKRHELGLHDRKDDDERHDGEHRAEPRPQCLGQVDMKSPNPDITCAIPERRSRVSGLNRNIGTAVGRSVHAYPLKVALRDLRLDMRRL